MVDINCSSVLILAAFVRFLQGLPLHQESNSEPFLNYLESFDFDQPNSPLEDQQLSLPVMNVAHKKNIAIGRADGFRPGK